MRSIQAHAVTLAVAFALLACACRSAPDRGSMVTPPALLMAPAPGATLSPLAPLTIEVQGTADIETVPDEFVVTVQYDATRPDPQSAKRACDQAMSAMLAAAKGLKIDPRDVQTQDFWLGPRYEVDQQGRTTDKLVGYDVRKAVAVTMRDAGVVEPLLAGLFAGGATSLTRVEFLSSKVTTLRAEARSNAALAAREKAEAMLRAASPGQKLGRALKIDEQFTGGWTGPNVNAMEVNHEAASATVRDTMAAGKIRIAASALVTYELVDG